MALYVLDTDILNLVQLGDETVLNRIDDHLDDAIATTIITVEEQLSGWYTALRRSRDAERLAAVYDRFTKTVQMLSHVDILTFSESAIRRFEWLRKAKLSVRAMDLRIASIVMHNNATLITRNIRDFSRVPELTFEDWSR
jgi:tRNA(fMet)-specific endonuclease VapC